jgi:acyl carrier protein
MFDIETRVHQCFALVFPDLSEAQIKEAVLDKTPEWDSLSTVTLLTVLEEQFAIQIPFTDVAKMISFRSTVDYLRDRQCTA